MSEIENEIVSLIDGIHNSKTYTEYIKQKNLLAENPDLKNQVDHYREEIYKLQRTLSPDDPNANNVMQEFADRYADFLDNTLVSSFLDAETDLCKMMQELTDRVVEALELE